MALAWQKLDLEGGGLQSANLRLIRHLKRRKTAYLLWILFPLGAHRIYLDDLPRAFGYAGLTAVTIVLYLSLPGGWALGPAALAILWALYDLVWIERRITRLNKQIRLAEYLRPGNRPPAGFRGRYTDEDSGTAAAAGSEASRNEDRPAGAMAAAHGSARIPSFAEQERILRELAKRK